MRIIIIILISILSFQYTFAQIEKEPVTEYKETMYPITNTPASKDAATFLTLFEDTEVGNLKVYSTTQEDIPADHYFRGQEIPKYFYPFFSGDYRYMLENGAKAYATYSIKGNESEHFIIRMPAETGNNTLILFELQGETLEAVGKLAFVKCKGSICLQQDSFVTDLDGDTDLDILIKTVKFSKKRNRKGKVKVKVMLQDDDGSFDKTRLSNIEIEPGMYNMKEMDF